MSIQGLDGPSAQGISGVLGLTRTEEERRQSRNSFGNDAALASRASLEPRDAFDASLDAMLADTSGSGVAQPAVPVKSPATEKTEASDPRTSDRFTRSQDETPATYNASGRLNGAQPAVVTGVMTGALASQPTLIPRSTSAASSSDDSEEKKGKAATKVAGDLSSEEEKQVLQLRQRDQEVRAHEQAHQATGGEHAGGISYTYQRGPDNRQYAVGGSVPIDVSPVADDPEATLAKAAKVRAAAMAPASPSGADQQVAAKAAQMAAQARVEQSEKPLTPEEDEKGLSAKSGQSDKSDKSGPSGKSEQNDEGNVSGIDKAEKAAEAGITALNAAPAGLIQTARTDKTDKPGEPNTSLAAAIGATGASRVAPGTNPLLMSSRPADSSQHMADSQDNARDAASSSSPALATRAAYTALQQLWQSASDAGSMTSAQSAADPANPETMRRALGKASAAYTRARGETGLAPLNTGISIAV